MKYLYNSVNPWWDGKEFDAGISRERYLGDMRERLARDRIEIFSGGRGTGKTTLLMQIVKHLLALGTSPTTILYLPMQYPAFAAVSFKEHLHEVWWKLFRGLSRVRYLLIDELQENPGGDAEIGEIFDPGFLKIFAAATLPPPGRGRSKPSARRVVTPVHPLDFREFLRFRGQDPALEAPERMIALAEEYLLVGGYPSQVLHPAGDALAEIIAGTLGRDMVALYELRKPHLWKDLLRRVGAVAGARTSFRQLAAPLCLSADTVKDYIGHMEEVWLVKSLERWSSTRTERMYAPKKIYFGDNGLATFLMGDEDIATRAENAVFLKLWHDGIPCGYDGDSGGEVDFVLGARARPFPVDVRYETAPEREACCYEGLKAFIRRFPRTRKAVVITRNTEDACKIEKAAVRAIPLWKILADGDGLR